MKTLFSTLLIAASIIVFVMIVKPHYENLRLTRASVSTANTNLQTASKLAESREALIATYNSISKTDLDNIQALLPDTVNNIRLIIQINSLATKNGLSLLRNVDYQSDQAVQDPTKPADTTKPYGEFVISFQTAGQYQNFLSFIADLERNLRLVDVTKVEFNINEVPAQTSVANLMYKVTLKTYWLKQ